MSRSGRITLNVSLILANLVLAALVFRVEVINAIGPVLASRLAGAQVNFAVSTLSRTRIEIDAINIADAISVKSVTLDYRLSHLMRLGAADRVEISGLRMNIRAGPDGAVSVDGFLGDDGSTTADATSGEDGVGIKLPAMPVTETVLRDAEVFVSSPFGEDIIAVNATLTIPRAPAPWPVQADILALSRNSADRASLRIGSAGPPEQGGDIDIIGDVSLDLPRWSFVFGGERINGAVSVNLDTAMAPDAFFAPTDSPDFVEGLLSAISGYAVVAIDADRIPASQTGGLSVKDAVLRVTAEFADGSIELRGAEAFRATLENPLPRLLQPLEEMGFRSAPLSAPISIGMGTPDVPLSVSLDFENTGALRANGTLALSAQSGNIAARIGRLKQLSLGTEGTAIALADASVTSGALRLGVANMSEVRLNVPEASVSLGPNSTFSGSAAFDARISGQSRRTTRFPGSNFSGDVAGRVKVSESGAITVTVTPKSNVTLSDLTVAGMEALSLPETVTMRTVGSGIRVQFPVLEAEGALRLSPIALSLKEGPTISLGALPFDFTIDENGYTVSGQTTRGVLSKPRITAASPDFTARWRDGRAHARLSVAKVEMDGQDLLVTPTSFSVALIPSPDGTITARGELSGAEGAIKAAIQVTQPADGGASRLDLRVKPIEFAADGVRLETLSPILAGFVEDMRGSLEITTEALLATDGISGQTRIRLDGIGFDTPAAGIRDLSSDIILDLSRPPATIGTPPFSLVANLPGLGRLPIEGRFGVAADATVSVPRASFPIFGGKGWLENAVFQPDQDRFQGTLHLSRVSLTPVVAALGIDGVFATGTLSGSLPITAGPEGIGLQSGTLASGGGGILRIDNPAIDRALAGQHEYVGLMLDALKDFRYDGLNLTLHSAPGETGALKAAITGRNPNVADGRAFNININLETDFNKFLDLLDRGLAITDRLLDRLRGLIEPVTRKD